MSVELRDLLLMLVRWSHLVAAVALLGGGALCLTVLRLPASQEDYAPVLATAFREVADLCLVVFLASGALLTFERLSSGAASSLYVALLAVKVVLSLLLYRWVFQLRQTAAWRSAAPSYLIGVGALVLFLAVVLKTLFEAALRH
jgi:hypothetical protein